MTERIDHVAEANANLAAVRDAIRDTGRTTIDQAIAIAQVQATLALVEQKRIANLMTLLGDEDPDDVNEILAGMGVDPVSVKADIVAAMGWS